MHRVTLIPGDGIGPEVTAATRNVLSAAGADLSWEVIEAGMRSGEKYGNPLPQLAIDAVKRNKVALKGPTETPPGPVQVGDRSYSGVTIALRKELDLFASLRPVKNYR